MFLQENARELMAVLGSLERRVKNGA